MKAWQGWLWCVCVGGCTLAGCDKGAPPPKVVLPVPEATTAPVAAADKPAFSEAELLNGTYHTVSLSPLPFTAKVPASWDCKLMEAAGITSLQGPAVGGGEIAIELKSTDAIAPDKLTRLLDGAKRVAEKEKATTPICDIRNLGDVKSGIKVLEVQKLNPLATGDEAPVSWQISFFVHRDVAYEVYTLNMFDMTRSKLAHSGGLVRKIIDSIQYLPAKG